MDLYWFKYTFYYFSLMHFSKGLLPLSQGPYPANNGPYVKPAAGKKTDNRFPDRPVMTETSLKGKILLYQSVKRKSKGLGAPAHFCYMASGPGQLEGRLQGNACTRRINDA